MYFSFPILFHIISSFIMKKIYKLLAGAIVMLIAVMSLMAYAGPPLLSATPRTGIVFNPATCLTMTPGGTQPTLANPDSPKNHDRLVMPFFEPWDMGSFAFQQWTFIPSQGNWAISTTEGNPIPTAMFTGTPALTNYNYTLRSYTQSGEAWTCANLYLEFDYRIIVNNPTLQEKLIIEIYYNGTWFPVDSLVNDFSTGWVHHKVDITEAGGTIFHLGFRATGINSADIAEWDVDNIYVYPVCFKPPDFNLDRTGNIVHLSWRTPCTGKKAIQGQPDSSSLVGYNLYRTNETGNPPFVKINASLIADTEYYDHLPLINGNFCYYVTARYVDSFYPPSILCEPPSDTLCVEYTAGIIEHKETQVRIYPNPIEDVMNVETGQGFTGIELLNFLGEKMYSESFPATKFFSIPMKDIPQGIYLVKIKSGKEIVVRKVLKN
jgi:hypothetical protein